MTFIPYDGTLTWQVGDDVVEASFSDALTGRDAGRRYRTAISTELDDGLPKILASAHERLKALRAGEHRDAGGLVIAADSSHARRIAKVLRETCGVTPTVVLHQEARAHAKLQAFRTGRDPWIVAVNMVSEGVDIPRLRVGVYATAAKTPLIFRQIVGRFVRTITGRPAGERSWVYLPGDPVLRVHAGEVETELRHVLRPVDDEEDGLLDEPAERRRSEPLEPEAFVPVAADVSPQLALFGGGPPPPAAPPSPLLEPEAAEEAEDDVPAWERRTRLRDKRHGLVASLRRLDGRSFREINAWLNRETGVTRVEDASLAQLERSIDLLLAELDRRSKPLARVGSRAVDLTDRRLLITGVLTDDSIAFAVAERAQRAGADIILTGFDRGLRITQRIARRLPTEPPVLELDVNDPAHLEALAADLQERWGASTASCTRSPSRRRTRSAATSSRRPRSPRSRRSGRARSR